jgi:hypothetical protein
VRDLDREPRLVRLGEPGDRADRSRFHNVGDERLRRRYGEREHVLVAAAEEALIRSRPARSDHQARNLVAEFGVRREPAVERGVGDLVRDVDLLAPLSRVDDEPGVVPRVGGRRDDRGELDQAGCAAGGGQLAADTELALQREHVGRLVPLDDGERSLIDEPVALAVEVARLEPGRPDRRDDTRARLRAPDTGDHDRGQHALLGGEVLRRDTLGAHRSRSRSRSSNSARRRAIAAPTWRIVSRFQTSSATRSSSSWVELRMRATASPSTGTITMIIGTGAALTAASVQLQDQDRLQPGGVDTDREPGVRLRKMTGGQSSL